MVCTYHLLTVHEQLLGYTGSLFKYSYCSWERLRCDGPLPLDKVGHRSAWLIAEHSTTLKIPEKEYILMGCVVGGPCREDWLSCTDRTV